MNGWPTGGVTPEAITRIVLPIIYGGTSLRLLAVLRDSKDPAVREMGVSLAATAAAGSTLPPSALAAFEQVLGDANYGRFLSQLGTVVAAGTGNSVMLRSAYPHESAEPKVRARRRRMVGTLALMTVLFARDRALAAELQVPSEHIFQPLPAVYWLAVSEFMVQATGDTGRLAFRTSRLTRDESLRSGLRCVGAGTLLLATFYAQYAAGLSGRLVSRRLPGPLRGVSAQAVVGTAAAAIAVGTSLPGLTWRARKLTQAARDARLCAALAPVWRPLRTDNPHATLPIGSLRSPDLRLFRRVIEILDGLDRLASRRDPQGRVHQHTARVGAQHGLSDDDLTALERAVLISYGTTDQTLPADHDAPRPDQPAAPLTGGSVHQDFRREAQRLLRTATYLRSSDLPDTIANRVRDANDHDATDHDATDHDDRSPGVTTMNLTASTKAEAACTCLQRGTDEVGYLEYAVGRAECDKVLDEERARCAVHGAQAHHDLAPTDA